ncbi:MAG: hypothetical protein C4536_04345 [Actinobacteria bacterium]|nr:MAG: hypothetical protein C4536_04345 [Actinomycetota bacterium]
MDDKRIEIDGVTFNLEDPEEKRAAVRAWLEAKSRARSQTEAAADEKAKAPENQEKDPGGG